MKVKGKCVSDPQTFLHILPGQAAKAREHVVSNQARQL